MTLPLDSGSGQVVATPSLVKECSCLPVRESTANQLSLFRPEQDSKIVNVHWVLKLNDVKFENILYKTETALVRSQHNTYTIAHIPA